MLRPAGDLRLDLGVLEVVLDVLDHFLQEHLPPRRPLRHQPHDLVVPLGEQRREREVLELPLHGVHAEPVRQRREDLQGLARLLLLLRPRDVAQRAHVVQPVGQLDDQDPDVARHGDDHLADGLGLRGVAVLDLVQLGDAVHQRGDVLAEVLAQLVDRVLGVLDRVVQQRGADRVVRHAQLGQDRRHGERVRDVRIAAAAGLAGVQPRRRLVGPLDEPDVGLRVRGANGLDQRLQHRVDAAAARRAEARQPAAHRGRPGPAVAAGWPAPAASAGGADRRATRLAADRAADFLLPVPAAVPARSWHRRHSAATPALPGRGAGLVWSLAPAAPASPAAGVTPGARAWVR